MWDGIKKLFQSLVDFLYRLLLSVFDFLKDFFFWILDQLFQIAIFFLDTLGDVGETFNPVTYIDAIPAETKAMMAMVGVNEMMAIIVPALIVRLTLQLIPFVRLGS